MIDCPICGGMPQFLGFLATKAHFRCSACGAQYSIDTDDIDAEILTELEEM